MKLINPRLSLLATASAFIALTLMPVSVLADGQRAARPGGGGSSSGGSSGGGSSGGSRQGSGGSGGSHQGSGGGAQPRSGTADRGATPRTAVATKSGDSANGGGDSKPTTRTATAGDSTTGSDSGTPSQRTSEGRPVVGHAVRRTDGHGNGGGTTIIVPGGYYGGYLPWGYAGLGLAGYYGGYYDGYGSGYGYPQYSSSGEEGSLRLKVKPRDASVFVDGYFAGQVDQFDGVFQRLHVEPGPHRIEISADGYETLTFEIRAEPDHTTTYSGTLTRVQ